MKPSLKPVSEQVMVITGASSGIGLATAQAAAKKGAKLVLAARNEDALRQAVQQITMDGGQATYVVADVGKREDVERIANTAISQFGGFDTWVNNAGVGIWGRLEQVNDEDSRRLFDTNFWGLVYGSHVALQHLKKRGGALINLGSVASDTAFPLQGMYCASKHAIKAFTDTLRIELANENAPVSVTLIKPSAIGTPFPEHAGNFTGKQPKLPAPIYAPEEVAAAIVYASAHPRRDIYIGGGGRLIGMVGEGWPTLIDFFGKKAMFKAQLTDTSAAASGNSLYKGSSSAKMRGLNLGKSFIQRSLYTRALINPLASTALLAGVGVAAVLLMKRKTLLSRFRG